MPRRCSTVQRSARRAIVRASSSGRPERMARPDRAFREQYTYCEIGQTFRMEPPVVIAHIYRQTPIAALCNVECRRKNDDAREARHGNGGWRERRKGPIEYTVPGIWGAEMITRIADNALKLASAMSLFSISFFLLDVFIDEVSSIVVSLLFTWLIYALEFFSILNFFRGMALPAAAICTSVVGFYFSLSEPMARYPAISYGVSFAFIGISVFTLARIAYNPR